MTALQGELSEQHDDREISWSSQPPFIERIEAMVTPHISDYQWRGVRFEAVREFIRNRRPDIEREINGEDMPLWPR